MPNPSGSWREFNLRSMRDTSFIDPDVRSRAIEEVFQIVHGFMVPAADALTPMTVGPRRSFPPGGEHWCLDDWLVVHDLYDLDFDYRAAESYWDTFGSCWDPPGQEIVDFLAAHNISLRRAEDASLFHHAWIGRASSTAAVSLVSWLEFYENARDEGLMGMREAEFVRLAPLLKLRLNAAFYDALIGTLFWMSSTMALAEMRQFSTGIVRVLFERRAQNCSVVL